MIRVLYKDKNLKYFTTEDTESTEERKLLVRQNKYFSGYSPNSRHIHISYNQSYLKTSVSSVSSVVKSLLTFIVKYKGDKDVD
jgi:hypothetical protein